MKFQNSNIFPELKKRKIIEKEIIKDYVLGFIIGVSLTILAFPFSKFLKKNKKRDKAILFGCIFSIFFIFINSVVFLSYKNYRRNYDQKNLRFNKKNKKSLKNGFMSMKDFVKKSIYEVFPSFSFNFNFWTKNKDFMKKKNLKKNLKKRIKKIL